MDLETHDVMSQALIERGIVTADQVAADRASLEAELNDPNGGFDPMAGHTPQSQGPTVPLDEAGQANAIDAAAFAGPASPADYRFERAFDAAPSTREQLQAEQSLRTALHAEAVPVPIARQVDQLLAQGLKNPPTPAQLEHGRQIGAAQLAKDWGADRDKNLAIANNELRRLSARMPALPGLLAETGVANSAWLAKTLFNQAKARGRA